jgi:hypothetical protein
VSCTKITRQSAEAVQICNLHPKRTDAVCNTHATSGTGTSHGLYDPAKLSALLLSPQGQALNQGLCSGMPDLQICTQTRLEKVCAQF